MVDEAASGDEEVDTIVPSRLRELFYCTFTPQRIFCYTYENGTSVAHNPRALHLCHSCVGDHLKSYMRNRISLNFLPLASSISLTSSIPLPLSFLLPVPPIPSPRPFGSAPDQSVWQAAFTTFRGLAEPRIEADRSAMPAARAREWMTGGTRRPKPARVSESQ